MLKRILSLAVAIAVSGCASNVAGPAAQPLKTFAPELGLVTSEIVYEYPARFATVPIGTREGAFKFGLYVQTTNAVRLFAYDPVAKSFHLEAKLAIADLSAVAVGEFGATQSAKQLQLFSAKNVVAIILYNNSSAATGTAETTQPAYDGLISARVPAGAAVDRVIPSDKGGAVFFVPMR